MGSKMVFSGLLSMLTMNVLWTTTGYAAPLLEDAKDPRDVSASVTKCSPDGDCWQWSPALETRGDSALVTEDEDDETPKLQLRRQITSPVSEYALKLQNDTLITTEQVTRRSIPIDKQTPFVGKNFFGLRKWGAGGMPFSVLYMKSFYPRSNAFTTKSTTQQPKPSITTSSTSSTERPNYQRKHQSTMQPRRQFLTIPQFFISYGWDAYKK